MRSKYIGVRLPEDLLARVDEAAAAMGERRSLAIRSLLRQALAMAQPQPAREVASSRAAAGGAR